MGDRTNPMKFGPEWLRNLSREPRQPDIPGGQSPGGAAGLAGSVPHSTPNRPVTSNSMANAPNTSKVLLAKLRYGREEMLALYDRQTAEAPSDLICMELLYHPRGKPPYALNNNFEDDTRDVTMRNNNLPIGGMTQGERYGVGRGRGMGMGDGMRGRGMATGEARGRARGFVRQTSAGSESFRNPSWHNGTQRGYPGAPEDDQNPRWSNNGATMHPPGMGMRPGNEQADWATRMAYRKTRQNNTNWRQQQNRDEGEEWRADGVRRGQEKWSGEREWPEKPNQERSWNNNRRTWGDNTEDTLPEWAVENSEAYAGTFDSLGAFHGYSNDDSNIPKQETTPNPLARSHTHGSFARSKTAEEGSDEWWASEKAKKLSAKRFDATEVKFKKPTTGNSEESASANASLNTNTGGSTNSGQMRDKNKLESGNKGSKDGSYHVDRTELQDEAAALPAKHEAYNKNEDKLNERTEYQGSYSEKPGTVQERIDRLRRAEENDSASERGNYKSVMMTTNSNHLRQKHQNIGSPTNDTPKRLAHLFESAKQAMQNMESSEDSQQKQQENKLVEEILDMNLDDESVNMSQLMNSNQASGLVSSVNTAQMPSPAMQMRMNNQGMGMNQNMPSTKGPMMRPIGMHNSMLNASLGLSIGTGSNMVLPLTSMPPPPLPNPAMLATGLQGLGGNMQGMQSGLPPSNLQVGGMQSGMQVSSMQANNYQQQSLPGTMQGNMANTNTQAGAGMAGFPGMSGVGLSSMFMQQGAATTMHNPSDMSGHGQQNMYPMHGHSLQQSASQGSFNTSMYSSMMQSPPAQLQAPMPNIPLTEQWYYEDPKKTIQGPFTSKEMMGWYRAGFFSQQLLVRRACENGLRSLANYGLMPFGPMDMLPQQFGHTGYDLRPQAHDNNLINSQQGLGPEVESLWSQPNNDMWIPSSMPPRDDNSRINNLPMYFWDQPSGMAGSLLPEGITKEMRTEDEILAQMRASQDPATQNLTFMSEQPLSVNPEDAFTAGTNIAPNLEELQKLIASDIHGSAATPAAPVNLSQLNAASAPTKVSEQQKPEKQPVVSEPIPEVSAKHSIHKNVEPKLSKQPVKEIEKPVKTKDVPAAKTKKKGKEDKDGAEKANDDDLSPAVKQSAEPPKNKKEDKANKKDVEKEKKEWLKDGFTIVKGAEKKDSKKKEKEEARAAEENERKRKEEEKRTQLEAEKNRQPEPVTRRQQMQEISQAQRAQSQQQPEQVAKKAPWSAPATAAVPDHLALSDIQRLEREKKLEQKEYQLIQQAIAAQQQAAASLRDHQEAQAVQLGWATKKQRSNSPPSQTLAEIQAEARKQTAAASAAAASAAAREEAEASPPPVPVVPWGATNGGGFWDSPAVSIAPMMTARALNSDKNAEMPRPVEPKPKKKVTVVPPPKKDISPSADFVTWCNNVLANWRDVNIDIPTFVAFLRDIESPYEVKDYIKCYLGDNKEATDFARQFLERRSRLLRVGMVTPSDDLGAPAAALTPRTNSGSDYTEVKGKTKKNKKNKMFKVDARILGFSVTASEDRINIGDIDTV